MPNSSQTWQLCCLHYYQLLSQSVPWSWTCERDAAFKKAKLLLTSDCVLVHFDPEKDLVVSCDASSYGLGAVFVS